MFRFSLLTVVLFTVSALAYTVTSPGQNATWTSTGPNTISWERVTSDASTFSVVLVNENRSVLPVNNQLLADAVDGTNGNSISVSPPAGQSFPVGAGFRINFIKSATDINSIYAQSSEFTITQGSVVSASGSATAPTARTTYTAPSTSTGTEAPTPVSTGDASVHLSSFCGALITALVVTLITV